MHLSPAELGGYIRLLSVHYRFGTSGLPDDDIQLRRITGLDNKTWKNSRETLLSFFELSGDRRWVHGKVLKVLSGMQSVQEQNRDKALKRWKSGDAAAKPEQSSGNATAMQSLSQKPEAISQEELISPSLPNSAPEEGSDFSNYFNAYAACCLLLGTASLSTPDQELLSGWVTRYDMNAYVMPAIRKRIDWYMKKHGGKRPTSLSYFDAMLKEKEPVSDIAKSLATSMKGKRP
jgi:uncharacterized protein YdaU (DUF1376 family)